MRVSVGAKVNLVFVVGLLLLAAVGFLAYRSIGELVETGRAEGRALEHTAQIEHVYANMRTAESLQRRHLITGEAGAVAELDSLRSVVSTEILAMRRSMPNASQARRLDELARLMDERFDLLALGIQAGQSGGLEASAALMRSPSSRILTQRIGSLVDEFKAQESRSLTQRRIETEISADTTTFILVWGGIFALALLVWAMAVINRYHAHKMAAAAALRASAAQMRLITDAIPALIAYLDANQCFRFHNKAFEQWFNRRPADFEGLSLRELVGADAYATMEPHIVRSLAGEEVQFNFTYQSNDTKVLDLAANLVPGTDESGAVAGIFVLVTDVSELRRLERLKAEFVATVSHELRTPLTSIRGSLGLLAGGVAGALPESARALVDIAHGNCERLVRLVNDILDFDKIESRKTAMNLEILDLQALVERSVRANEGFAAEHRVAVQTIIDGRASRVRADSDRLAQVMANLLSNACKFSPHGGVVEVRVANREEMIRVEVSDRGPGIPESFRSRMFQRFSQADSSDTRSKSGTGLGLAITHAIVAQLNGRVGFEARERGGTTFYFELREWRE